MTKQHLGFVGIGRMAGHMAARLLDAGHAVSVFDRSEPALAPIVARGGRRAASAAEVASHKDVRLCLDEAEALGVPMIVGSAVRQILAIASATFGPESDFTSIIKRIEQWAGVEVGG